jgi:hypothetical protein
MPQRRRSVYLPHLTRTQRNGLAAALVERGYRAEVRGDSVFTDAPDHVISFLTPVRTVSCSRWYDQAARETDPRRLT